MLKQIHLWIGIMLCIPLVLLGLSGSILVYDEALGLPDEGLSPGTRFADIPEDWYCPDCGSEKGDFERIED